MGRRADASSTAFSRGMYGILPLLVCLCIVAALVETIRAVSPERNFNDLVVALLAKLFESLGAGYRDGRKRHLYGIAGETILFNIDELLAFGLPVVLNPIYAIPFTLAPLASYIIV